MEDLNPQDYVGLLKRHTKLFALTSATVFALSAFYGNGFDQKVIRFCFAKQDHTLLAALDKLKGL